MPFGEEVPWTIEGQPWNLVLRHALGSYPKEACGILLGPGQRPHHIVKVRPTRNATSEDPAKRYLIDPLEFLDVDKWAEQRGLNICGFYHSHPDHPPAPSDYDRKLAWEGYLYLIVSIKAGIFGEARAWIWNTDEERFGEVIFQSPHIESLNRNPQC
jgi:proteasome lid subunit RPN8/RPN11